MPVGGHNAQMNMKINHCQAKYKEVYKSREKSVMFMMTYLPVH